jgi:hypothetical protein
VGEKDFIHFGNAEFRLGLDSATRLAMRDIEDGERTMLVPTWRAGGGAAPPGPEALCQHRPR